MPSRLKHVGAEAIAIARQGRLMLTARRDRAPRDARHLVAFVHGYGASGAVFLPLRERVERELGVATLEYTYGSRWSFDRITRGLAERLGAARRDGVTLDIVGHSLGGLVTRWYLQELGGAEHVRRAVLLATPHDGTTNARLALGPVRSVLSPRSPVLSRLAASRASAEGVVHTALVAGADLMIRPPASAAALSGADVRWFDDVGHNEMLFHDAVHDAVLDALRADHPGADVPGSEGAASDARDSDGRGSKDAGADGAGDADSRGDDGR